MEILLSDIKPHPQNIKIYGEESVDDLIQKIQQSAWIKPLTITQNNVIISGHRRYLACRALGVLKVPVEIRTFNNEYDELEALLLENEYRLKTQFQRIREGGAWEKIEAEKAKQRKEVASRKTNKELFKEENNSVPENFPPHLNKQEDIKQTEDSGEARDIIAKKIGLGSGRDYDKGKKVVEAIDKKEQEGDKQGAEILKIALEKSTSGALNLVKDKILEKITPQQVDEIKNGEKSIKEVSKEIKKEIKEEERKEEIKQLKLDIETTPKPLSGKYDIIVIDPPWQYGTEYDSNGRRVASPYPEMTLEEIASIEIPASDNSVIWLWTTHKFMRHSFTLIDKWGFQDKVILTWVKDRIGVGAWLRSQTEFCIMAVKGTPIIQLTNQSTVLNAPTRQHSRKPDEFYKMVDSLCVGRKLDYFSRENREGWSQYGNDIKRF